MKTPILSVKNLTTKLVKDGKAFAVVDNISFELFHGKTLAIVGESGSGKSMTALSIMRVLPTPPALPSSGEVLFGGQNLLSLKESEMRKIRGSKIAMVFQDPSNALNPVYTIGEQLLEVLNIHFDLDRDESLKRCENALFEVGISAPLQTFSRYPHELSGGMKQRVMIAMTLLGELEVLIADEPTTALDVTVQAQVLQLIRELQKKRKMAVLLITHDLGIVAEMADEVIVMYAAEFVEQADVLKLFEKPLHPYTQGLFNSRPENVSKKERLKAIEGFVPPFYKFPSGCHFHPRCPFAMPKCKSGGVPIFEGEKIERSLAGCMRRENERPNIAA